jgi:hypothetical protein
VLGGNPAGPDGTVIRPEVIRSGSELVVTDTRGDDCELNEDLGLSVEYGANLSSWTAVKIGATSFAAASVTVTVVENGDEPDDITVRIPTGTSTAMFARLRAIVD